MSSLRRTMGLQIAAMIVGVLLLAGAGLWGIQGLHQDFSQASSGIEELRELYEVSSVAKGLMERSFDEQAWSGKEVEGAAGRFKIVLGAIPEDAGHHSLREALQEAIGEFKAGTRQSQSAALSRVLNQVINRSAELRQSIRKKQEAADEKLKHTLVMMAVVCGVVIVGVLVLGFRQYRAVTGPLGRLGEGARQLASGKFDQRIGTQGYAEIAALAEDFNRMAGELEGLYRDLEQKVAQKSRELVQSERLASVGYLAAGVAHEISNPLGIIAGYAEMYLAARGGGNPKSSTGQNEKDKVEEVMKVICQEAFRCKQIIEKLLTLARPGEEKRQALSLKTVAEDVVAIVGGLGEYREKKLQLNVPAGDAMTVVAAEGEMKQVLLNLTLNALEAVEAGRGQVEISLARAENWIEATVSDNGRGMSEQVLERVFEPFFTVREKSSRRGTGLGLSISHAIVREHGGEISAYSEGPGKGSRFVVRLPAGNQR